MLLAKSTVAVRTQADHLATCLSTGSAVPTVRTCSCAPTQPQSNGTYVELEAFRRR